MNYRMKTKKDWMNKNKIKRNITSTLSLKDREYKKSKRMKEK